jgi:hypothetical protein
MIDEYTGKTLVSPLDEMYVSPPVVIEEHSETENKVAWLLSFGGSNPDPDMCIELTETQCWWLHKMIMKIDPNLFARTKAKL